MELCLFHVNLQLYSQKFSLRNLKFFPQSLQITLLFNVVLNHCLTLQMSQKDLDEMMTLISEIYDFIFETLRLSAPSPPEKL